jgi:RNA polymerase sigma factor (sigma-70 family)
MTKQFDSLNTYVSLAKKTIAKFAPKFYTGLSVEMLQNEEAISDVATAIMYADWRFDETRTGKTGKKKTLYSYRNQCAIWAIKTYITNKYKSKKYLSLDHDNNADLKLDSIIADTKQISPLDTLIENEYRTNLSSDIESLFANSALSNKQKEQIMLYYFEDKTLSEIGKKFGVSREAVRQNIKRGLEIIKNIDKCLT